MNLRYEILRAVSKNPGAPAAEICDAIDYDRQKTTWSVRDCAKAGLLTMRRDDVTGQPGYTLTEAGKERLADGPTKQGGNAKHSQPAVEQNTGSSASDTCTSPAEGAAVQAHPAPDHAADVSAAAPVAEDEMQDDDEIPPADASLLALANRELSDRLARVAHVLRGSGLEALKNLDDGADLQSAAAAVTGAYQMALGELHAFTGKIADLQHKVSMQDADLFKVQNVLGQRIHIGNPPHHPAPVKCAELAASMIDSLLAADQENHNLIAIASEKPAEVVAGDIDTSDMEVHELADQVVAQLSAKDDELLEQGRVVGRLRAELANEKALVAKLEHLLQSARNEAEHLRKHAPAPDTTTMDTVPLDALLDAVRAFVPISALLTVSGHPGTVSIAAFGHKFHIQAKDALDVLDHIRALDNYLDIPF